ncbi:MAG: TadE/TadG family type IV pilus assembly protein [Ilumatobacteraceae bacterium]
MQQRDRDRGAVDVSIQMLFGMMSVLFVMLLIFEVTAYWHARNVFDEAAAEGARVAAAYDGTCTDGVAAARSQLRAVGGSWTSRVRISCTDGPMVTVSIAGSTPGAFGSIGFKAVASESAPKEQ